MARSMRVFWPALVLVSLFFLWITLSATNAYQTPGGSPDSPNALTGEVVKLPSDPVLKQKYDAAREYIQERRWAEAVRLLQTILDAPDDVLFTVGGKDGVAESRISLRIEAERLLSEMPDAGLEFYRATQNVAARQLRARGAATHELRPLEELVRRYRFTPAGIEALEQLGLYHLDQGDADLSSLCFRKLLATPGANPSPRALHAAALSFRAIGDLKSRDAAWKLLEAKVPKTGLVLDKRTLTLADLRQEIERWPDGLSRPSGSLYRGDARRSSSEDGDVPVLEMRWNLDTTGSEKSREFLQRALRGTSASAPLLPGSVPIARAGRLFYRSAQGVHALDISTGHELWRVESPLALDTLLQDPGKAVQLQNWLSSYLTPGAQGRNAAALLCENLAVGTLSCDGRYVYQLEDLPLPPNPNFLQMTMPGAKPMFGPLRNLVKFNRLRAIDLFTGEVAWEQGEAGAGELTQGYFLGPPLPTGGHLYVAMEKGADFWLVCLSTDGKFVRRQKLAGLLRFPLANDLPRRLQGVHLTQDAGILVCATGAGVIVGVDCLTLNLLWAHVYRDRPRAASPENALAFDNGSYASGWKARRCRELSGPRRGHRAG